MLVAKDGSGLCWNFTVSDKIAGPVSSWGFICISGSSSSLGRGKRRSCGLMIRNRRTLMVPER